MLIIVPSRGRPANISALIESFTTTRIMAKLLVVVDSDDPMMDEYDSVIHHSPVWVSWHVTSPIGMPGALNKYAKRYCNDEDIIGFMGDDHRPRTFAWDAAFADALINTGIAYGNDLLQGSRLPTQVMMTSDIIQTLGFMCPYFQHLYVDNYWKTLGERIERLHYLDHIVVEHLHPVAGKAEWDDRYKAVNDGAIYQADQQAFLRYLTDGRMDEDVAKVKAIL